MTARVSGEASPLSRTNARHQNPVPPERLASLRVLFGLYGLVWSVVRIPAHLSHLNQPAARWQPIGVLGPFDSPLPDAAIVVLTVGTPLLGALYVVGWRFAVTGPAFAGALLAVATLDSSWGQIFHTENLMVLHVGILALAPGAADVSLVGAFRRRSDEGEVGPVPATSASSVRYAWPIRLAQVVVVLAYVLAGLAKLDRAGIGWGGGEMLRNLVAHDNLRKALLGDTYSPLGAAAVRYVWLFPLLAIVSLAVELGAWVALLGGRLRTVWVAAAWGFHVGVLALMAILFPYQLTGVAFAPFFRVERLRPFRWLWGQSHLPAPQRSQRSTPRSPRRRRYQRQPDPAVPSG